MSQESGGTELEALRRMVLGWKDSYRRMAGTTEEAVLFAGELRAELEEVVYPYMVRLRECGYIEAAEVTDFIEFCERQAGELGARV
ncbi:MAG TPA: hypothetical protein VGS09_00565 [Actinomycetota bacterium]|jgi:hypothetical protein|nr:hypothetical protein [Actinomycetota bacterium]